MHPVPFGLIAAEHDPSAEEGAVGGNGNSEISIGSGLGAIGYSCSLSRGSLGADCLCAFAGVGTPIAVDPAWFCANTGGAIMQARQAAREAENSKKHENRIFIC